MLNMRDNTRNRKLAICGRIRKRTFRPIETTMKMDYYDPTDDEPVLSRPFLWAILDVVVKA
jgi:hypothetical protein